MFYVFHEFELLSIYQLVISVHMTSGPFPAAPRCLSITASPLLNRAGLQLVITWAGPADGEKSRIILSIYLFIHSSTRSKYFRFRYAWSSSRVLQLKMVSSFGSIMILLLFLKQDPLYSFEDFTWKQLYPPTPFQLEVTSQISVIMATSSAIDPCSPY